jgi:flagellin-like protein
MSGYNEESEVKYMQHKSKRGIRSKRGISTVVASILVLAITVCLAVGLLTFGSSFMASQQKMQPPTTDQIKIENVYFKDATEADVTVRNVGSGAVTVSNIYVNGQDSGITGATINPGSTYTFQVSGTGISYSSGSTYTFKAATGNGGENTYTATYTS